MVDKKRRPTNLLVSASLSVFLAGCGIPDYAPDAKHLSLDEVTGAEDKAAAEVVENASIPALVQTSIAAPTALAEGETFDVIATDVSVRDLLFALSRDSGINMDIDGRVKGVVSINAFDQPLDLILERLQRQVDFRVTRLGGALVITPDTPYYQRYDVSFISIERTYSSSASTGSIGDSGASSISNSADNDFWNGIEDAVGNILAQAAEVDEAPVAEGEEPTEEAAGGPSSFNLNRNAGVLLVYANEELHKEVEAYLNKVLTIAKRQVLLEATIVEVSLSNDFAQGVDWSVFNSLAANGFALYQGGIIGAPVAAVNEILRDFTQTFQRTRSVTGKENDTREQAELAWRNTINSRRQAIDETFGDRGIINERGDPELEFVPAEGATGSNRDGTWWITESSAAGQIINRVSTIDRAGGLQPVRPNADNFVTGVYRRGDISAAVELLDRFGDTKVLSSPRLSALNNQPALLRVGTQEIYFDIDVDEDVNQDTGRVTERTFQVETQTVDTGFSMNVLPYIDDDGSIILNLRPAVNRLVGYVNAPTPANLGGGSASVQNRIPILAQRELETIISLEDGEIAVLGGLLEDRTNDNSNSVPGLSDLPGVGKLFQKTNQNTRKTEFIVFIKARIIKNPSVRGDYSDFVRSLPGEGFFKRDSSENIGEKE